MRIYAQPNRADSQRNHNCRVNALVSYRTLQRFQGLRRIPRLMLTCGTGTCNKSAVDTQIPILFDAGWGKVPAFFTWHTADDEKRFFKAGTEFGWRVRARRTRTSQRDFENKGATVFEAPKPWHPGIYVLSLDSRCHHQLTTAPCESRGFAPRASPKYHQRSRGITVDIDRKSVDKESVPCRSLEIGNWLFCFS